MRWCAGEYVIKSFFDIIDSMLDISSLKRSSKLLVAVFLASACGMSLFEIIMHVVAKGSSATDVVLSVFVSSIGVVISAYIGFCGYIHVKGNLVREVEERTKAEKNLQNLYQNLENEVARRTMELRQSNELLTREIDERARVEILLKKSESRMRGILSAMTDFVFAIDEKTRFTFAHVPTGEDSYLSPEVYLGHPHNDVMPERLHEQFNAAFEQIRNGQNVEYQYYLDIQGEQEWFSAILSPAYKDGVFEGGVAVIRNITEVKRKEEKLRGVMDELQRSNEELEQFAYVASHDLKDPLVTLGGYLKRLERKHSFELSHEAFTLLSRAFSSVEKMERLIDKLLSYACMHTDPECHDDVNTGELVEDVLEQLSGLITRERAVVSCSMLPVIKADRMMMQQLFQNLISNAIKHRGNEDPVIRIGVEWIDNSWIFSIHDNGMGIPETEIERIFKLFERLNYAEHDGSGIGLAVCKKIVEIHGGKIWVESVAGKGSVFRFSIPALQTS